MNSIVLVLIKVFNKDILKVLKFRNISHNNINLFITLAISIIYFMQNLLMF